MGSAVIEIPILEGGGLASGPQCAECLRHGMLHRPGVTRVSLRQHTDGTCIELEYDADLITVSELERDIRRGGACLADHWGHAVLPVRGMMSTQSEDVIESALRRIPGLRASATYASQLVRVEFDRSQCAIPEIIRQLEQIGYPVDAQALSRMTAAREVGSDVHLETPRSSRLARSLAWLSTNPEVASPLLGGLCLLFHVWAASLPGWRWLDAILIVLSFGLSARYTGPEAFRSLAGFQFNIDVLMFVAAGGAVAIGRHEEGALLLFLFGLGTAGENLAMDRARRAIQALSSLSPDTARVRADDGAERDLPIQELRVDERVVARPGERIAADGEVVEGASSVDQSPITGESTPVDKSLGDPVYAGTINGNGLLVIRVTRLSDETRLAKIIKLVSEAQTTKSPTQTLTDRVERVYVPFVLVATVSVIVGPTLLGGGDWSTWFYRAMAFLTAASPCALAIGTPAAVLSGIARAARGGVLIKGGVHLENLSRVSVIAFDKTGTLTRGAAEVTDVTPAAGFDQAELLALAASIEQATTHPIGVAIVAEARRRGLPLSVVDDVRQMPGVGIDGRINGANIAAVRPRTLSEPARQNVAGEIARLESDGKTVVVVTRNGSVCGVIGLADRPRPNAAASLKRLRALGVKRCVMLTGDNHQVAAMIARDVGADEVFDSLMPDEKVDRIRELAARHGAVAMVGDGVNDAPALAAATVGIAMGGVGTDAALETADVALMADDLAKLPEAVGLSRFSRRIIFQNLVIALGVILVMAPVAALGGASLGVAVIFHEGSTVVVVLNALRLLVYRPAS